MPLRRPVLRRPPLRRPVLCRPLRSYLVLTVLGVLLSGCGAGGQVTSEADATTGTATAPIGDGATPVVPGRDARVDAHRAEPAQAPAELAAGVLDAQVPDRGEGTFTTAEAQAPAPDPEARTRTVAVQVEDGLPADAHSAADFVLATLNDPRGWPSQGYSFARIGDPSRADILVVLASPATSAQMCRPLVTNGRLSCRQGSRAILTWYRWVNGHEDYGEDRTGYRQYVVNHEVGHTLGRGHVSCPGAGRPAPVMMQQTKGLQPCTPNPWVDPDA